MITFPAFTVLCVTHAQQSSAVRLYFYVRAPAVLFQRGSFTVSPDFCFGLFVFLSHWTVTCPPGRLRCRGLMYDTHPCFFFLSHSSYWSSLFMSPIDLMHGDFVLDFRALCNICHWVIVPPIRLEEADYNKKIPWHLECAWESWWEIFPLLRMISDCLTNLCCWTWMRWEEWSARLEQSFWNAATMYQPFLSFVESPYSNLEDSMTPPRPHSWNRCNSLQIVWCAS